MPAHLSDQIMAELLEGPSSPEQEAHLAACEECASRLEQARATLDLALQAEGAEVEFRKLQLTHMTKLSGAD